MKCLADKGYLGPISSSSFVVFTSKKTAPNQFLTQDTLRFYQQSSSAHILVKNFFGELSTTFQIIVHRWSHEDLYYLVIFEIWSALANFNILQARGQRLVYVDGDYHWTHICRVSEKGRSDVERGHAWVVMPQERRERRKPDHTLKALAATQSKGSDESD
jgi:hypothetical protein